MKKLFENKLNFIPIVFVAASVIGVLVSGLASSYVGIIISGISLIGTILLRIYQKKYCLNEFLIYITLLICILLLIGSGLAYGTKIILSMVSDKDIG